MIPFCDGCILACASASSFTVAVAGARSLGGRLAFAFFGGEMDAFSFYHTGPWMYYSYHWWCLYY